MTTTEINNLKSTVYAATKQGQIVARLRFIATPERGNAHWVLTEFAADGRDGVRRYNGLGGFDRAYSALRKVASAAGAYVEKN